MCCSIRLFPKSAFMFIVVIISLFAQGCFSTNQLSQNDGNFTIVGGQIYTPGLVIVDSPQPFTPMGGEFLQIALDISGNGALPFPPRTSSNSPTFLSSVTLFLSSYTTNLNLTISNASSSSSSSSSTSQPNQPSPLNPPLSNILTQEPSSTVKHVNYLWPLCLVGGSRNNDKDNNSATRGAYNISIHQTFRLNSTEYYTVFDLPIAVTNDIPSTPNSVGDNPAPGPAGPDGRRLDCEALQNPLLSREEGRRGMKGPEVQPFLGGGVSGSGSGSGSGDGDDKGGQGVDGGNGNGNGNGNGGIDSTGSDEGRGQGLGLGLGNAAATLGHEREIGEVGLMVLALVGTFFGIV